jgi:peptide/nickel transport system ATP-binding protein
MSVLVVQDLTTSLPTDEGPVPIVRDVSFELAAGRCLAIVGESGSGKSMTALSILGLVPRPLAITSGQILLEGKDLVPLSGAAQRRVRGREIAMIFQEPMTSLNPVIRVGEQVIEALLLHEKVSKKAAYGRALELFERVGIPDPAARLEAYPHQLSGGLKQRAMIAMALIMRPKVLLADEPTTALDVTIQAQILRLLRELMGEFGTALLLITHDLGVVNQIADEVAVFYAGRIVERAPRDQFFSAPAHPYSVGLLDALPARAPKGARLREIPGHVPSPTNVPAGCAFAPRCPKRGEACDVVPRLEPLCDGSRRVACFYPEEPV